MGSDTETRTKYDSLMKNASALYLEKQFQKALALYNDALKLATDSNMSKVIICILKYMICCCLYESHKLEDLAEVVNMLQAMDRTVKNRFPAVYCLLAKTHCKLYRFELAEIEFSNADAIFTRNPTLESFCIPGTDTPIRPTSKDDEVWAKIKEECTAYHQPDAICSFPDCNYIAKPYVVPNKNIFLKDPAFNGMVIVNCNNKDQPCVLKFHQSCWKMKKDELYPIQKVSDKDIVGDKCFTPNCLNGDTACVISSIQVIDQKGELKAHIKENPSTTWSVKPQEKSDKITSKGAIKKVKVTSVSKKPENPLNVLQQKLLESINQSKGDTPPKDIHSEDDNHYYDESQIVVVKDVEGDTDFSYEPPQVAGEKSFLLSLFLDYIRKNRVTIGDVYSKFNEYNQDLHIKDLDILGFLLNTNKFEVLSNESTTAIPEEITNQTIESFKAKSYDDDDASFIDDVYYELMNEKEEEYVDCTKNAVPVKIYNFNEQEHNCNINLPDNNYPSQYNLYNNNNNIFPQEATTGGGDASAHLKNNLFSSQSGHSGLAKFDDMQSPMSPSKGSENRKLKDYITQLESDMEKIIEENSNLRKEIVDKDKDLESFRKEHEGFEDKIKKCEELFETMTIIRKGYNDMSKENVQIKEELVKIMKEKNDLEAKLEELQDPDARRSEFMKLFQEEYAMLQQVLNEEWENKTDILKKSLKAEIEVKMGLLNKLLNCQFSSNKHVLTGYLERCSDFVEVTTKVNVWMEKSMNVKNFVDNSEWLKRLEILQRATSELQGEYSILLNELHSDKEEKFKMTDINLKTSAIPNAPKEKLSDVILNAFNAYYRHQYQIMQNYVLKAQAATQAATQAMQYQMPQAYNSIQPGYVPPYPFASTYPIVQPSVPTTPLISVPTTPTYQWTPRTTTGPPPNLTFQQTPLPTRSRASTPIETVEIEQPKIVKDVQSAPLKDVDVLASKEDAKDVKENEMKAAEKIDTFEDKIQQMREAFKTIALNVKEKSNTEKFTHSSTEQKEIEKAPEKVAKVEQAEVKKAPENAVKVEQAEVKKAPEKVATPTAKIVNQVKDNPEKVVSATKTVTNGQAQSIKDSVSIRDDRSDITTLTTRDDPKSQKKVGMDGLVKMLQKKFPGAMECDVIEAIAKIRKDRNNALTGVPVSRIIEEAKPHIQQSQRLHVIRYFVNDGSK